MRNFQKIKTIEDYKQLDAPVYLPINNRAPVLDNEATMVLRMLVRPKYGDFIIPPSLYFLSHIIHQLSDLDFNLTGIKDSWCYVTIRSGEISSVTDDEWHFDGASFRTDIIPERNYIWVSNNPTEYKSGSLEIPDDFDPNRHNLFTFAAHQLKDAPIETTKAKEWYMLSPLCLHRRPTLAAGTRRTFYRIAFTDIEGRDINNTENPFLPTPFFGRNPVQTFRNKLVNYYGN